MDNSLLSFSKMCIKIPIDLVPINRISVSFTWDDNAIRHASVIAPLFVEKGLRCTFYIVPGDIDFDSKYLPSYIETRKSGFEIGSHSYSHKHMTALTALEKNLEFNDAIKKIEATMKVYPITFAFPNHDYNENLINQAYSYHLETRNTLSNSRRFSLKTNSPINQITAAINDAIDDNVNLVFSGHSIVNEQEYISNELGEGYEPIRPSILVKTLQYLTDLDSNIDVVTFLQATLREWVRKNGVLTEMEWRISSEKVKELERFHITESNLISLL